MGYCQLRETVRHFAIDRIVNLKEKWIYFKPLEDFDLEKHFSHSWGIYDSEEC